MTCSINQNDALYNLVRVRMLLTKAIELPIEKASVKVANIRLALSILQKLAKAIPAVNDYVDELTVGLNDFNNSLVPFISFVDGHKEYVDVQCIYSLKNIILIGNQHKPGILPSQYKIIDEATGKIALRNGKIAYSTAIAVKHSINSTAKRWIEISDKMRRIIIASYSPA